jgi:hypothetical protein
LEPRRRTMRIIRGMGGALLWVVAALLGLVGVLLCVTVILLPLGLPLLLVARKLFGIAIKMVMPRAAAHPVKESGKSLRKTRRKAKKSMPDLSAGDMAKKGRKRLRKQGKRARKRLSA